MTATVGADSPFPLIRVAGAAHERGFAYGVQARSRIEAGRDFYAGVMLPSWGSSWGQLCDGVAAAASGWRSAMPEILDEVEGIARGSGLEVREVLALNARGPLQRTEGCTSFSAVGPRGHMFSGQNWDHVEGAVESVVLLHVSPDVGPAQLHVVEAGQVARLGANAAGVSLQANGLPGEVGLAAIPSPFARRRALAAPTLAGAIEGLTGSTPPHGNHLLLTHRDGFMMGFELAPDRTSIVPAGRGWIAHANHEIAGDRSSPPADPGSLIRQQRVERLMDRGADGGPTRDDLVALLRDHAGAPDAICAHADQRMPPHARWATIASTIVDLDAGTLAVASGPPCRSSYVELDVASGDVVGRMSTTPT